MTDALKIMIVDDEPSNLELFSEIFSADSSDRPLNLKCCQSGDEALEHLESFKPNVVILDIMMPGTDGIEVCKMIKNHKEFQKSKVIMVTGMAGSDVEVRARAAGCDQFYLKPVSIITLRNEVFN